MVVRATNKNETNIVSEQWFFLNVDIGKFYFLVVFFLFSFLNVYTKLAVLTKKVLIHIST